MLESLSQLGQLAQERIQLSVGQVEQLLECRRRMLHEVGMLIGEWDRLWKELQVRYFLCITSDSHEQEPEVYRKLKALAHGNVSRLSRESTGSLDKSTIYGRDCSNSCLTAQKESNAVTDYYYMLIYNPLAGAGWRGPV